MKETKRMSNIAELRRLVGHLASRMRLRRFDAVGRAVATFGAPSISNQGRIELAETR